MAIRRKAAFLAVLLAAAALAVLGGCSDARVHGDNSHVGGSATLGTF